MTKSGDVIEVPVTEATDFKSLAGFAVKIGVHRETLLNWTKEHPDFFDAYKLGQDHQEQFLSVNANKGLIPPVMAIFTLKNVSGWRDKKEVEHSGAIDEGMSDDLEKRLKNLEEKK